MARDANTPPLFSPACVLRGIFVILRAVGLGGFVVCSMRDFVAHILRMRTVAEVGEGVIRRVSVSMAHFLAFRTWTDERLNDQFVNHMGLHFPGLAESHDLVSISSASMQLPNACFRNTRTGQAFHSSEVRDFIRVFVSSNRTPLFYIRHTRRIAVSS
jgi:hypothetical protein